MKQIVLSEGKRDVELLERYFAEYSTDVELTTFIAEDVEYSRLKNRESKTIRNFLEPRNPYQVLAKSENGKPDLKTVFVKLVRFLVKTDASVCLLIDLDSRNLDALHNDLDTRVRDNYQGQTLSIRRDGTVERSSAMVATRNRLLSDGEGMGSFDVLAFDASLERVANIEDGDSDSMEQEKLDRFLRNRELSSPIHRILG